MHSPQPEDSKRSVSSLTFYAHSLEGEPVERWEELSVHLHAVAGLAAELGEAFGSESWTRLAGLWHDLGKYRPEFQRRLRGEAVAVEHSGLGAAYAEARSPDRGRFLPLAFVIAGHHAGLANLTTNRDLAGLPAPLLQRLETNRGLTESVLPHLPVDLADPELPRIPEFLAARFRSASRDEAGRSFAFWIRLLFSALVDADRLATGDFYNPGERARALAGYSDIGALAGRLDTHLRRLVERLPAGRRDSPVNQARAEVLAACRAAAERPPGLFSLNVPTGGGKTLSSMAFALEHARCHGLRRVIVAIPFTSIIEQNAAVYRGALGEENVLEHHSALEPDDSSEERREAEVRRALAAENWDAPVIVTTNVQLFESLFTNHPSRARKLHRIAGSVLLLDEAQTLPAHMLLPVLDALRELTSHYGCSVVLSTATQPALEKRDSLPQGLEGVREIIPDPERLAAALRRVEVRWPEPLPEGRTRPEPGDVTSYAELASRMAEHPRALAVVHRRKDARVLAEALQRRVAQHEEAHEEGSSLLHLSALMCPAHRRKVLTRVRRRLVDQESCRLVSTQLIEAGVDVDFPVVYRALAGLDSIAQAAGRCNREGRQSALGRMILFRAETPPPPGFLATGLSITEGMLQEAQLAGGDQSLDLGDPELFQRYFRRLYFASDLDAPGIQRERTALNFATVSRLFQMIDDAYSTPIVVRWGEGAERIEALRALGPTRDRLRALQPYTVNVPRWAVRSWLADGVLEEVAETIQALTVPYEHLYHEDYGLTVDPEEGITPEAGVLVV